MYDFVKVHKVVNFYKGKGLQTVFNETTVGEQNPLAEVDLQCDYFKLIISIITLI